MYTLEQVKKVMRPLDVLLFKGGDVVSGCIAKCQKRETGNGDFSHAALVVDTRVLDKSRVKGLEDGIWYVWEITMSGKWNDGVTDIYGDSKLAVQLRKFDDVMKAVFKAKKDGCQCAWVPLKNNPFENKPDIDIEEINISISTDNLMKKCTDLCLETYGRKYERSPFVLLAAILPCLRKCIGTKGTERFFCSEFVAWILKEMGIETQIEEQYVIPVDFIPSVDTDKSNGITCTEQPVLIME